MNVERRVRQGDTKRNPIKAVLASVFGMFVVSGLLLLLLAMLLYKADLTEEAVKIGIVAVYVVSGLSGGFLMGKIMCEKKYLWGLVAGGIYFAVLFMASAFVKGGFEMDMIQVSTTLILCAASGMAGGMIS